MTHIAFYFDPSCPFSWITSRWLLQVSVAREMTIDWRPFSLALKNNELTPRDTDSEHAENHRGSHRIQRVILQAATNHGASIAQLYSEFGMRFHIMEEPFSNEVIKEVLMSLSLPAELLDAADDTSLDTKLQKEIDTATTATGGDIGVPTIVFIDDKTNEQRGYFGPILQELPPTKDKSLMLWDGLEKLTSLPYFYEIKRSRSGGPNVFSAASC